MRLSYNGQTKNEPLAPYSLFGDKGEDILGNMRLDDGSHSFSYTIMSSGGNRRVLERGTVDFEVDDSYAAPAPEPAPAPLPEPQPTPEPEPQPEPAPTNETPIVDGNQSDVEVDEDSNSAINISGLFSDADGDALTYELVSGPSFIGLNPNTGEISINPVDGDNGNYTIQVQASDGQEDSGIASFDVTVNDSITPPPPPPPSDGGNTGSGSGNGSGSGSGGPQVLMRDSFDTLPPAASNYLAGDGFALARGQNSGEMVFDPVSLSGSEGRLSLSVRAPMKNATFDGAGHKYEDYFIVEVRYNDGTVQSDRFDYVKSENAFVSSTSGQRIDNSYQELSYDLPSGKQSATVTIDAHVTGDDESFEIDEVSIISEEGASSGSPGGNQGNGQGNGQGGSTPVTKVLMDEGFAGDLSASSEIASSELLSNNGYALARGQDSGLTVFEPVSLEGESELTINVRAPMKNATFDGAGTKYEDYFVVEIMYDDGTVQSDRFDYINSEKAFVSSASGQRIDNNYDELSYDLAPGKQSATVTIDAHVTGNDETFEIDQVAITATVEAMSQNVASEMATMNMAMAMQQAAPEPAQAEMLAHDHSMMDMDHSNHNHIHDDYDVGFMGLVQPSSNPKYNGSQHIRRDEVSPGNPIPKNKIKLAQHYKTKKGFEENMRVNHEINSYLPFS